MKWSKLLNISLEEENSHVGWWSRDARNQVICRHDINLVGPDYFLSSTRTGLRQQWHWPDKHWVALYIESLSTRHECNDLIHVNPDHTGSGGFQPPGKLEEYHGCRCHGLSLALSKLRLWLAEHSLSLLWARDRKRAQDINNHNIGYVIHVFYDISHT